MEINRDGFVAKLYLVAHHLWWSFRSFDIPGQPERVDLCTLVRTIVIGAPLAIAVNAIAVGAVLASVGYFVFGLYLHASAVGLFVVLVLAVAIVGAVILGAVGLTAAVGKTTIAAEVSSVLGAYYRAKKSRICPIIKITGGK